MKQLTDQDLLTLLRQDDNDAFNEIYSRYWEVVYAIACKKLNNREEAKDVVHDLFMIIWQKRHSLKITTTFIGFIYTILKNKLTDLSRRQSLRIKHDVEFLNITEETDNSLFEQYSTKEMANHLRLEIQRMPVGMRTVFEMSREEELSVNEIAGKLSISSQTVKNQITSALKRLRLKSQLY
ncbi:RNA polymerase sigma-70 factor [Pedobacter gandavensis]|uniref:RNA polymerase sigma factor n=1 Tax=Pedobacter gandavensis TaxID=2679963 RepID=UPI002930FA8A|nr:RNA polymerase sigma-70 factor [Pedobacter gandavensis]